ncbi:hypothetical protein CDES_10750 [Corynebacterium deserti GIMN1.010]|uniref:Uncharacterized protein n=1 Tax=Corynebacterium deserti GIMN1.010 TaxID=931089 RepID=A0A0M4CYJ9_9CORY|nr:hypothetical protein [Corynebacterium deserti]ALC06525.1 hypothetical protein CDES_10750 [Corynebacterium deserti GIMN1.010]
MSYDFVLFETDGDPGSARISKTPLTERIDFATPATTPVLESLASGLAETAPDTVTLDDDAVYLSGDRCLYVVTNYNSAEEATAWLTTIAFDYGLGLADMNADTIILFGDEDSEAVVQIDGWFSPAFSSYGLPHLLVEVMRLKDTKTPYLRVTRASDDSTFIQTLYEVDNKQWLLEKSTSGEVSSSHVKTINDVITEINAWFEAL